ncbi:MULTISPECIES: hypothetical protein [unclassified Pseudomonas]|uniref:hypothetical protein n=1 Tax=unclassified Pseudomonas TaxID=196821 RepID=UPI0015A462B9|nr:MULTISPECIES: hypothetical protein [unclassified Pseudomonas]NWC96276.1 hypothetical protein [Pseudomonas sp. IPO3779]NWD15461.1 hypothetical protein [Pseudomonas sp. IPO3778]
MAQAPVNASDFGGASPLTQNEVLAAATLPRRQSFFSAMKNWFGPVRPFPGAGPFPSDPFRPGIGRPKPDPAACRPGPGAGPFPTDPFRPGIGQPKPDPATCRPGPGAGPFPTNPYRPGIGRPKPEPEFCTPGIGQPDPYYSRRTNDQLAEQLYNYFDKFLRPGERYVTREGLEELAKKDVKRHPGLEQHIRAAREILNRPQLWQALDRNRTTGAMDGLIDRRDIAALLNSTNPFNYHDDRQLAQAVLEQFDALKGVWWKRAIKTSDLKHLANQPLTGDADRNNLIQIARAVTQRPDLFEKMNDFGRITKATLQWLSRFG